MSLIGVAALALLCTAALSQQNPASSAARADRDPRIAAVESKLAGRVHVVGEPADAWSLAERMAFHNVPGVSIAVLENGRIAWANGYGVLEAGSATPVDVHTIFQAASISKPIATIAALRMVERRQLELDAPINAFLTSWQVPDNTFTAQQAVTLRQIMSHSAGFTVHGFPGYSTGGAIPTVVQVLDGQPPANTPPVRVDQLPGVSWRYSGGGYTVMQLAMMDASGKAFPDVMRELVLEPVGMTRSTFAQPLPQAYNANAATAHRADGSAVPGRSHAYPEMAAAGLWTTPSDLLRLGLAVVAAARAEPNAILGAEITKEMLTTQAGSYGLGFDLEDRNDGQVFSHGGANMGFISLFFTYADGRGGAAIMVNGQNGVLVNEIAASISAVYGWKYGAPEERTALRLTPQRAAQFAGDYVAPSPSGPGQPDLTITITAQADRLWLEAPPAIPRSPLYVASDTQVFLRVSPMLDFTTDENGRPERIHLGPGWVAVRKADTSPP